MEQATEARAASSGRVLALDSLRGLAALGVCIRHSEELFPTIGREYFDRSLVGLPMRFWPFRLIDSILNPYTAVIFFFVLSGYVLAPSIEGSSSWRSYAGRRLWRLYPPLIVSVLACWLAISGLAGLWRPGTVAPFAAYMFGGPVSWSDALANCLLVGTAVNKVTWTVRVELWCSMLLPVILLLNRRIHPGLVMGGLLGLTVVPNLIPGAQETLTRVLGADFSGLQMLYCFALGAALARRQIFSFISTGWILAVSVTALVIIAESSLAGWIRDICITAAAGGVIVATARHPWAFLSKPPFTRLGEISYSLYLLHPVVLYCAFVAATWFGLSGIKGAWFLLITSIAVAIPISSLSRKYIELPSIAMGRRLTVRAQSIKTSKPSLPMMP